MSELNNYPIHSPNLKGYQHIDAIWFPFIRFSKQQCTMLIIQNWINGCQLYAFEQGYLLHFPTSLGQYCDEITGWPLISHAGKLCSTRLTENEQKLLPNGDIILLQGHHIVAIDYSQGEKINPASWLNINDYMLLAVDDWTVTLIEPEYIDFTPESKDIESILGDNIPKPSTELLKYIQKKKLEKTNISSKNKKYAITKTESNSGNIAAIWPILFIIVVFVGLGRILNSSKKTINSSNIWDYVVQSPGLWLLLGILLFILSGLFFRGCQYLYQTYSVIRESQKEQSSSSQQQSSSDETEYRKYNKPQNWRNYLARFAILTKLHHLIAFRQGKYIDSMMKMFENGNLDEALKHALPLNSSNDGLAQQTFGVPKPRNKLSLSEKYYGSSSSIFLDTKMEQRLRELYRQSFEKLAKENRIEEATFVLIELLNNLNEGIEYLEKNKRYQQALDIAIARDADPNIIVRLCCLTEQWDKAIMIARRDHAFANTIMLLQKEQSEFADKLRLIWAKTLAEQAEWLAAIEVIWPLKKHRYLAEEWFNYAEQSEEYNADVVIKRLILQPDSIYQYQFYIEQLQSCSELYNQRLAIAISILKHKNNIAQLRVILRPLLNIIIADILEYPSSLNKADLQNLIDLCQDKTLKIDLPKKGLVIKEQPPLSKDNRQQKIECSILGNRVIYDAVSLNNGLYLLALGDAGVIVVDKMGKQQKHYMATAHRFVLSYNSRQVIMLAKRENYYQIHKLDTTNQRLTPLGHINFQYCLWTFDGIHWSIVVDNHIRVVDIQQSLAIVWQVDLNPYTFQQTMSNSTQECWLLKDKSNNLEHWNYSLPTRRLQYRSSIEDHQDHMLLSRHYSGVHYFSYSEYEKKISVKFGWYDYRALPITMSKVQFDGSSFYVMKEFIALIIPNEEFDGADIYIYDPHSKFIKMIIDWPCSTNINVTVRDEDIIFYDQKGRCCHLDVQKNSVIYFTV